MTRVPEHLQLIALLEERLSARKRLALSLQGYRQSAVALLLREDQGVTHVPFTVRARSLRKHSGQISLPGGTRDGDESLTDTAVRETIEELGIDGHLIRPIGLLDDVPTPTGFVITPVVAELTATGRFSANPDEVDHVFEAPISVFADPANRRNMGQSEFHGIRYQLFGYDYRDYNIWGATARILEQLIQLAV